MREVLKFVKFGNLFYGLEMGRKSLATERTAEILDAFERCISKYGFEGTTLAQIAEEAEVKRSLIRHYIGNREAVVTALIERIMRRYQQQCDELFALTRFPKWESLWLHYLFDVIDEEQVHHDRIIGKLVMTSQEQFPEAKARLAIIYKDLIARFGEALNRLYPHASAETCYEIAYAVLELADAAGNARLIGLGGNHVRMLRQAAGALLQMLKRG